jgi:DNA-binding GntR family transcriptional regulator
MPRPRTDAQKSDYSSLISPDQIDRFRPIGGQIYESVRLSIILGRLAPDTLINETNLAEWYGVSRTPVREAFQRLAEDGLVVAKPKVGTIVAAKDIRRVEEGIIIRRALELEVVKLICNSDFDYRAVEPVLALQKVAILQEDPVEFFRRDEEFHALLADLAGIPAAWRLAQSVKAHTDRERIRLIRNYPKRISEAYDEHLGMIDAFRSGDADRAGKLMRQHIDSAFEEHEIRKSGWEAIFGKNRSLEPENEGSTAQK